MTGTILQVYEDRNGRLYFRSDISSAISDAEKCELIARIQLAMMTELRGNQEMAVNACIRQLAFGSCMCAEDMEEAKKSFRDDIDKYMGPIREMNRQMKEEGILKIEKAAP